MVDLVKEVKRLSILDKKGNIVPFQPNWAQLEYYAAAERQLHDTGRVRLIILKARQLGISTCTEALLFTLCFIIDNYRAMVIAHEIPASQNLLNMTNRYWETYPFKDIYTTRFQGKNHLQWNETGSSLAVATAGNDAVGRSATIHGVHASEFAFWPDPRKAMAGLSQTVPEEPGTVVVIESTANGVGNLFQEEWDSAVRGESGYIPLFFPWHRHPEYKASVLGLDYRNIEPLDDEEKILRKIGISDDRLAWRRYYIKNKLQNDIMMFHQEYPTTPDEAFVSSGTNVFPKGALYKCYEPMEGYKGQLIEVGRGVEFAGRADGELTIYKKPSSNRELGQYLIAGDPTKTIEGDFACAQVINRRTLEQVAEWRGRIDPVAFADILFLLGKYYNVGLVSEEKEGPGYATIGALLTKNYPNLFTRERVDDLHAPTDKYGWSTTAETKPLMISWGIRYIIDNAVKIHSKVLLKELENYVTYPNGGYGPSDKQRGFDDTLMAWCQALTVNVMQPPLAAYGGEMGPVEGSLVMPHTAHPTTPETFDPPEEPEVPWHLQPGDDD